MDYIEQLRKAIRDLHGCESAHIGTTPVKEMFRGKTVWEGKVETFQLTGHARASTCYAWSHASGKDDKGTRYIAVLALPPVHSPQDAVRASIVADSKAGVK
jgi:hypothetical protein